MFLRNYALYLLSEQAQEEEILEAGGPQHKINSSLVVNKSLTEIEQNLSLFMRNQTQQQQCPLIYYLLGVVQKQGNKTEEAKLNFVQALKLMPCLWSAWIELSQMLEQRDQFVDKLPETHWMRNFYLTNVNLIYHQEKEAISLCQNL